VLLLTVLYVFFGSAYLAGRSQRAIGFRASSVRIDAATFGIDTSVGGSDGPAQLAHGPGLAPGSGTLGSAVPIGVVGHRVAFGAPFRHLGDVVAGATITVGSGGAHGSFIVDRVLHAGPGSRLSLAGTAQALVLVTGDPAYLPSDELVVVAHRADVAPSATPTSLVLPRSGWAVWRLFVGLVLASLVGVSWWARRRWLQTTPTLGRFAALVAILLAGAAACQILASALPPIY